ncbi:hypothetical protein EDD18DRAFT_1067547, partial [Armillaria luteobubalina]
HSHIHGLVLDDWLGPRANSRGTFDREDAGMTLKMAQESRKAGRATLLAGPSSTGKTVSIAYGMAQMLGLDVSPTASDIFSLSMSKTKAM